MPQTPFKRLKVPYCLALSDNSTYDLFELQTREFSKEPIQNDSTDHTPQSTQSYFKNFSYTPVNRQQAIPVQTMSVPVPSSKLDTYTQLQQRLPMAAMARENSDFDWANDTTGTIEGDSVTQDTDVHAYRRDSIHLPVVPDVLETDDQYFENQMSYEMSYADGSNCSFENSCATANDLTGFDSPGWMELEDSNLRQHGIFSSSCSHTDRSASSLPAKAQTPQVHVTRSKNMTLVLWRDDMIRSLSFIQAW